MYKNVDYRENIGFLALFLLLGTIAGNAIMGMSYSRIAHF